MNYLKYWRVVRYFINAKYGISQPDLEMLIFLYDEPYFTRAKFKEFNNCLLYTSPSPRDRQKSRMPSSA